ncbi:TPA: hypothetical protein ACPJEL_001036 [Haemophilus influenzae]
MGWKLQEYEIEVMYLSEFFMVVLVKAKKKGGFMGRNRFFFGFWGDFGAFR